MRAALPLANLSRWLHPSTLLRLDARRVINLSIVALSVLVVALAARTGWRSLEEFRQARQVEQVNAAANDFIAAAGLRELERTYGSALLAEARPSKRQMRDLRLARRQGDLAWQRAMERARKLAERSAIRSDLLARLAIAESSFRALRAARIRLDGCLQADPCGLDQSAWQQTATRDIDDSATAREAVFLTLDRPERPARLYAALQRSVWVISEYTQRQRGIMAFYLNEGGNPPSSIRAELEDERAVAAHAREQLRALASLRHLDPAVRAAVERVDRSISKDFVPLLATELSGALQADGRTWLAQTAPTIAALDALSATINNVTSSLATSAMHDSREDMFFNVLVILLACAVAALSTTKVRQTTNALFYQKELAEVTIRSIGDSVITTDASGRIEYINPTAEQMTGWRNAEARGLPLERVFQVANGLTLEPQSSPIEVCLRENRVVSLDNNTVLVSRDGVRRYIEDSAAPIRDRTGSLVGAVLVFYDATEVHQAAHLLEYRATHDALTGLVNRRQFEHRLAALLAPGRDNSSRNALFMLDLDQFNVVNESCGHLAGDHLLREISRILREHSSESDVLARLGSDEFGLIVRDCSLDEARDIGESLRAAVAAYRFEWQGLHFEPHLSIGLVPFGLDAGAPAALLSRADAACHLAKERGRNRLQVYDAGDREIERRSGAMHWIARLNQALADDRFTLHCQPVLSVAGGRRRHGEVLVRMIDADGTTLLPPSQFIPPAERHGFMPRVDRWVVHRTLTALGALYAQGRGEQAGVLAINLSGSTLSDPSLAQFLREEMRAAGVPPAALCFEITETAAVASLAETSALISALRSSGCAFSLDDFGRGMSSFMYLKQLPVDYLKIDGEFVRNIEDDPVSRAMVEAIHALGRAIGIATIAECVENPKARHQLETLGVDYVQGVEVAPPEPLSKYLESAVPLAG